MPRQRGEEKIAGNTGRYGVRLCNYLENELIGFEIGCLDLNAGSQLMLGRCVALGWS